MELRNKKPYRKTANNRKPLSATNIRKIQLGNIKLQTTQNIRTSTGNNQEHDQKILHNDDTTVRMYSKYRKGERPKCELPR